MGSHAADVGAPSGAPLPARTIRLRSASARARRPDTKPNATVDRPAESLRPAAEPVVVTGRPPRPADEPDGDDPLERSAGTAGDGDVSEPDTGEESPDAGGELWDDTGDPDADAAADRDA